MPGLVMAAATAAAGEPEVAAVAGETTAAARWAVPAAVEAEDEAADRHPTNPLTSSQHLSLKKKQLHNL